MAIRFIKLVFESAYVQINVNNKNIKVEFPKLVDNTLENLTFSRNPSEKMHNKLGRSIPIVNRKIKEATKIQITPIASLLKPPIGGTKRPKKHNTMQIGMTINL